MGPAFPVVPPEESRNEEEENCPNNTTSDACTGSKAAANGMDPEIARDSSNDHRKVLGS
jgi:hypothetical protein